MSNEKITIRSARDLVNDPERRKPQFLAEPGMDRAVAAIMRLAMEVSVLRDRLDTHEALAEKSGAYTSGEVDAYLADPERAARRAKARTRLIESLLHDLK